MGKPRKRVSRSRGNWKKKSRAFRGPFSGTTTERASECQNMSEKANQSPEMLRLPKPEGKPRGNSLEFCPGGRVGEGW